MSSMCFWKVASISVDAMVGTTVGFVAGRTDRAASRCGLER